MEQATEPNPMERPSGSGFGAAQSENDEQYSRALGAYSAFIYKQYSKVKNDF